MINIKTASYACVILLSTNALAMEQDDNQLVPSARPLIATYLPTDSVVRKISEENPGSIILSLLPFFKSNQVCGCDKIEEILRRRTTPEVEQKVPNLGGMTWGLELLVMTSNSNELKQAVRMALIDQSDDVKWAEHKKIIHAADVIAEKTKKRLVAEREAAKLKAEQKKIDIRHKKGEYMIYIKVVFYTYAILLSTNAFAMEQNETRLVPSARPLIATYLPDNSIIKKLSEEHPPRWLTKCLWHDLIENECDKLEALLQRKVSYRDNPHLHKEWEVIVKHLIPLRGNPLPSGTSILTPEETERKLSINERWQEHEYIIEAIDTIKDQILRDELSKIFVDIATATDSEYIQQVMDN